MLLLEDAAHNSIQIKSATTAIFAANGNKALNNDGYHNGKRHQNAA